MGPAEVVAEVPKTGLTLSKPAAKPAAIPELAKPLSHPVPEGPEEPRAAQGSQQDRQKQGKQQAGAEEYFKDMEPEIKQAPTIGKEVATTKKSERLQLRGNTVAGSLHDHRLGRDRLATRDRPAV
jgi:hypothetical protein